jgi:hypothetical protein
MQAHKAAGASRQSEPISDYLYLRHLGLLLDEYLDELDIAPLEIS